MKIQAQHLQTGDVIGSGERVFHIVRQSTSFASNKVMVYLGKGEIASRGSLWGKYTIINVKRETANA
jgi:hypothetical protein